MFSPAIMTINDLFANLSRKQSADHLRLLFILYEIYKEKSDSDETFDDFLYFGEMLLGDFDDVDKYLANARMLFSNILDLQEIDRTFDFLTPEQIDAIRSFWSSFRPKGNKEHQEKFLSTWGIMFDVYTAFRERLAEEGLGYEGMIFREVVEKMEHDEDLDIPYEQIVFVGLNALSTSEVRLLQELQRRGLADFYWDDSSPFVRDSDNKASFFIVPNRKHFPSRFELPDDEGIPDHPEIETIGIPSGVGQAKQVYHILKDLCGKHLLEGESALRTAVVLPDEHLLVPLLYSIPEEVRHINVTMGYPLAGTPISSLMDYILALQRNVRYVDGQPMFYYREVLPVLKHRYISLSDPEKISGIVRDISLNNRIYVSAGYLGQTPLLELLFTPVSGLEDFSGYLIRILMELNRRISPQSDEDGEEDEDDSKPRRMADLEQEFIFHYFTIVNRIKDIIQQAGVEMRMETYFRLLRRVTDSITIPFQGEPLSGLQIMGVLETRALDFDRVIILSVNEGIFPAKRTANSYIPHNLRRGFGLPTYEHQDSVWAYHFYRLIYRASHVTLLYDTRTNALKTGEKSRFIHQLHYHYRVETIDKLVVFDIASKKEQTCTIAKTGAVQSKLDAFRTGGDRELSASAINAYLDCPLKFYYSVVEGVQESDEVTDNIKSNVFGSILHKTLEILYKRFEGSMVTSDLLKAIQKNEAGVTEAITKAFAEKFFKSETVHALKGQNYLVGELIRKYVLKVLEVDAQLTPFHYVGSEKLIRSAFTLSDGSEVQLKGFIDRVDEVQDRLRIVDYKSGSGATDFASVDDLFDSTLKERPKAIMQVFFYAWLYSRLPGTDGREIQPSIYYMRSMFSKNFSAAVNQKIKRGEKNPVEAFGPYSAEFEEKLRQCLDRIFDINVPFSQTDQKAACTYCPFTVLCGR